MIRETHVFSGQCTDFGNMEFKRDELEKKLLNLDLVGHEYDIECVTSGDKVKTYHILVIIYAGMREEDYYKISNELFSMELPFFIELT